MEKCREPFRDLGEVPDALVSGIIEKIERDGELPVSGDDRFLARYPGLRSTVLKFPDSSPGSHLRATCTGHWETWRELVEPILVVVGERLGYEEFETSKILLSSLLARSAVPVHVDTNPSSQVPHKVHVPISTHPNVVFTVDGRSRHLCRGRAYEINNLRPHGVENDSDHDRLHLVVELFPVDRNG